MEETIIKIEHVSKEYQLGAIGGTTFREELHRLKEYKLNKTVKDDKIFLALNDINIDIKKGEAVGIIGHNGAGKSTLLKLLCRVTMPTRGKISYNGRIVSMLEVGTGFHPELTGRENIYMNGAILGMNRKEIDSKLEEIIEFSECRKFIDTPVKRYSSGMYVKLAFSVAVHLDAEIMIMDEVLAVGDMQFQKKCLKKMREAATKEGKTVLYVSHNMSTIAQLCDRCIVLDRGQVKFDGDVSKGIRIYMENGNDMQIKKTYIDYKRPEWLINDDMRILESKFLNKDNNIFVDDEKIYMKLVWKNNRNISDLCGRCEISIQEGNPIGSSLLENFYSGKEGTTGEIILEYDFPQLMEGSYTSYITFYNKDQYGDNMDLDCVNGLSFEKKIIKNHNITWNEKHWGNIKFDDPIARRNN